jgi:hypothetical protein
MRPHLGNALTLATVVAGAYVAYEYALITQFDLYSQEWGLEKSLRLAVTTSCVVFLLTVLSASAGIRLARGSSSLKVWWFALAGFACFLLCEPLHGLLRSILPHLVVMRNTLALVALLFAPAIAGWWLTRIAMRTALPPNTSLERTREG